MTYEQERIKDARMSCKLTQKEVANLLGMSQQAYQKLEAGKTEDFRISTLLKLCLILRISADWVLGIDRGDKKELTLEQYYYIRRRVKIETYEEKKAQKKTPPSIHQVKK